jgi:hypothetical protein
MLKTKAVVKKPTLAVVKAKPKTVVKKPATVVKAKAKAKPVAVKKPTVVKTKTKAKPVAVKKPAVAKAKPRKQYKGGSIPEEQIAIVDKIIRKFVEYSNRRHGDRDRDMYRYIGTEDYESDINDIISNIKMLNLSNKAVNKDVDTIKQYNLKNGDIYFINAIYSTLNDIVADIIIDEFLYDNDDLLLNRPNYTKYVKLYNDRKETKQ